MRATCALLLGLLALPAAAEPVAVHKEWAAFVETGPDGRHCYAGTVPTVDGAGAKGLKRGPAYLTVSFWPELARIREIGLAAGFPLMKGEPVDVVVDIGDKGTRSFRLISRGEMAWTAGTEADAALIAAMREGGKLTVTARSANRNEVVDEYSLWGFTRMMERAAEACGG